MIRIKNNGNTYTVSYINRHKKIVWSENEITEKSARAYGLELPKPFETIEHNTDWRAIYLLDSNWTLHYCIEGLTEKIESLAKKMRDDGQSYFISDDYNLDGKLYFETLEEN